MEALEAIKARKNVRTFSDRPIPGDQLDEILEAGRRSPSARNGQPWDFVVVTDRDQLARLSRVWRSAGHVARSAVTIALVASPPEPGQERGLCYDLGQATMSMLIAAAGLGIGSGHASVADQDLACEVLGLPPAKFCAYVIALGYPADRPLTVIRRPDRRPFDEVVHRGRW
jgi:nitroreductase